MEIKQNRAQIEDLILFSLAVAGKTSKIIRRQLETFYSFDLDCWLDVYPFTYVRELIKRGTLREALEFSRIGNYTKLDRAYREVLDLDVDNLTVESLESISGIGPKTARFIILYTQEDAQVAVLDTHILKWLHRLGYQVPRATPSKSKYKEIEDVFLSISKKLGFTPRELDDIIWQSYANGNYLIPIPFFHSPFKEKELL